MCRPVAMGVDADLRGALPPTLRPRPLLSQLNAIDDRRGLVKSAILVSLGQHAVARKDDGCQRPRQNNTGNQQHIGHGAIPGLRLRAGT
jgi:hypothetical protein